jgi:hypothetical protein
LSSQPVDSRADTIKIIPIDRKKTLHGVISDTKRIVRLDVARGITEATQSYIASRVEEELKGRSPNTSQDINDLKETVIHLTDIIQKNTGQRIIAKTNEQDKIDSEDDEPILGSFSPPLSPIGTDVFGTWKIHGTKPNGEEWSSNAWGNGTANDRTLVHLDVDPFDSRFSYRNFSGVNELRLDGNSNARFSETTTDTIKLLVVKGVSNDWKNTETTIWVKRELGDTGTAFNLSIMNRSNIYKTYSETPNDCGFGQYRVTWRHSDSFAAIGIIPLSPIDQQVIAQPWDYGEFSENRWMGFKSIIRDNLIDNTITVEGWSNPDIAERGEPDSWTKDVEFTFDGTNVDINPAGNETRVADCTNKGSHTAEDLDGLGTCFLNRGGMHTWIQTQNFMKVRFKWFSVREITPIVAP